MAFNFLQFAVPHGKGPITLSDISWTSLNGTETTLYAILVAVMLVAVIAHVLLTALFLRGLFSWLGNRKTVTDFLADPYKNVTIFPVIGSLAMSANVLWAPAGFFAPFISSGMQSLMLPSLVYFSVLFIFLFLLEYRVMKIWLKSSIDTTKFNFIWLLDVFAFGLVALTGSGIAVTSENKTIASIAGVATAAALIVGLLLLAVKLAYLIRNVIKVKKLPDTPILPAFFLVVPISCLFGLSLYRIPSQSQALLSLNAVSISSLVINLSYIAAIAWVIITVILLSNYFKSQFMRSKYSAPQWGMV
ncbi:MAG: hypothetical protein A2Z70_01740 [Chloroflexi bacterium RBG_13_48_17]|nr:MAG: hypothetical protein A2Z70_01740 [Chloroflexi bacterium RBG_13_48_17]